MTAKSGYGFPLLPPSVHPPPTYAKMKSNESRSSSAGRWFGLHLDLHAGLAAVVGRRASFT